MCLAGATLHSRIDAKLGCQKGIKCLLKEKGECWRNKMDIHHCSPSCFVNVPWKLYGMVYSISNPTVFQAVFPEYKSRAQ